MNNEIKKYGILIKNIRIKKSVKIIEDFNTNRKYVVKKNNKKKKDLFNYLEKRGFLFFPKIISDEKSFYDIYDYVDDVKTDQSQRLTDMVYIVSYLHNKTTFFKEFDINYLKEIYEKYSDRFDYLMNYYLNLQNIIEEEIYMSPSSYLLIRNISKIYSILNFGKTYLNNWYSIVENKKTLRNVLDHNNLKCDHLLESDDNNYLISWDRANFGFNADDIGNLYKNNYDILDLRTILNLYENKYKIFDYEYNYLIFILCSIDKINYKESEDKKIVKIYNLIRYVNNLLTFILKENSKN